MTKESIYSNYLSKIGQDKLEEKVAVPNVINKFIMSDAEAEKIEKEIKRVEVKRESNRIEVTSELQREIQEKIQKQLNLTQETLFDKLKKKPVPVTNQPGLPGVEYEEYDVSKIKFMKQFPRHELKHKDHSGIIVAKRCLREYFLSNVIGHVPAGEMSIFYPWGTSYHIFRQRLSELYGYGESEPKPFDEEKAKTSFKQAAREATAYWMKHGEDQKPGTKFDWFTTERLYISFVKAFEHWTAERKSGKIKIIAVEQYFNVQLMDGRYTQGRIDEAVEVNDELWGRDFKTTQKPEEWFSRGLTPNNQVRTYSFGNSKLANRPVRGLIIQAMYNAKSTKAGDKGPLVYEKLVEVTDYELAQWELEQGQWNDILALCREKDIWPQSEVNCSWCDYQPVCTKPTEASMIYVLENKYRKRLRDPANPGAGD